MSRSLPLSLSRVYYYWMSESRACCFGVIITWTISRLALVLEFCSIES